MFSESLGVANVHPALYGGCGGGPVPQAVIPGRAYGPVGEHERVLEFRGREGVRRLLDGFRGRPKGDLSAAVDAAMIVQSFALEKADRLLELELHARDHHVNAAL